MLNIPDKWLPKPGDLYELLGSLAGFLFMLGAISGQTPLGMIDHMLALLGIPTGWVATTQGWVDSRTETVNVLGYAMLFLGLLGVGRRGSDVVTRASSTTCIAAALLLQNGQSPWWVIMWWLVRVAVEWVRSRLDREGESNVEMTVMRPLLQAGLALPMSVISWMSMDPVKHRSGEGPELNSKIELL